MTPQQVFDTVVAHLRKQGEKAVLSEHQKQLLGISAAKVACAYRAEGGKKCAAGILIMDEEYHTEMENIPIHTVIARTASLKRLMNHRELIGTLQDTHDNYEVSQWEQRFQFLAQEHELTYTPPTA